MKHQRRKLDYKKLSQMTGIHRDILSEIFKAQTQLQRNETLNFIFNFIEKEGLKVLNSTYNEEQLKTINQEAQKEIIKRSGSQEFTKQFYRGIWGDKNNSVSN